jgi:hypothetical protein
LYDKEGISILETHPENRVLEGKEEGDEDGGGGMEEQERKGQFQKNSKIP